MDALKIVRRLLIPLLIEPVFPEHSPQPQPRGLSYYRLWFFLRENGDIEGLHGIILDGAAYRGAVGSSRGRDCRPGRFVSGDVVPLFGQVHLLFFD